MSRYRLAKRGLIKEGNWADVTIFDLASLEDRATYDHLNHAMNGRFLSASKRSLCPGSSIRHSSLSRRVLSLPATFLFVVTGLSAQNVPLTGLDGYVSQAMHDFKVPGLAIAIVKNDSIVLMKGYGTRTLGRSEPVNEHTIFAIGSSSKAFTAKLVAMMVDSGKMRWDDPATKYVPGLQMYDPYVSREPTVRDLLTHRSGLVRGDLMWYAGGFERDEVLRRVRFIQPTWSMRALAQQMQLATRVLRTTPSLGWTNTPACTPTACTVT